MASLFGMDLTNPANVMLLIILGLVIGCSVFLGILNFRRRLDAYFGWSKQLPSVMLILGSGGHTAEMLKIAKLVHSVYPVKVYVSTKGDTLSKLRAQALEDDMLNDYVPHLTTFARFHEVTRIRDVGQGWLSVCFWRMPRTFLETLIVILREMPDMVVMNGPGVCVPFCAILHVLTKWFGVDTKVVYIESVCRVEELSLTARMVLRFVDVMIVQWPEVYRNVRASHGNLRNFQYCGRIT